MKAIGFAKKFYTLWDVSVETLYREVNGQHRPSGEKCTRSYFQNLSTDLDKAQARFTELTGLSAPSPDEDLKGHTRSWTTKKDFQVYLDGEFTYGKYAGQMINECTDADYLRWYASDDDNKIAELRLCEIDTNYVLDENGRLTTVKANRIKSVFTEIYQGNLEVTAVSNFKGYDQDPEYKEERGIAWVNVSIDPTNEDQELFCEDNPYGAEIKVDATDLNLQRKYFRGYEYFTPKGMRSFKNQVFTVIDNKLILK